MTLKRGDKVKLLGTKSDGCTWEGFKTNTRLDKGDVGKVTSNAPPDSYTLECDGNDGWCFKGCDLEPIGYAVHRFNTGDKVKLLKIEGAVVFAVNGGIDPLTVGKIYTVDGTYQDGTFCLKGKKCQYRPECFELVITEEIKPPFKMRVRSEEESREVQEKIFKMGFEWYGQSSHSPICLCSPYLYCEEDYKLGHGIGRDFFDEQSHKEITVQELLGATKTEETKMELENMKSKNLVEAKKQALEEKMNAEIIHAKTEFVKTTNAIDKLDREIKKLEEEKKSHLETLAQFK